MSRGSLETDIKRLLARLADTVLGSECGCLLSESMSQELVIYLGTVHLGERRRVMYSQVSFSLSDPNCPLQSINAPVFLTCISELLTESLGVVHTGGL